MLRQGYIPHKTYDFFRHCGSSSTTIALPHGDGRVFNVHHVLTVIRHRWSRCKSCVNAEFERASDSRAQKEKADAFAVHRPSRSAGGPFHKDRPMRSGPFHKGHPLRRRRSEESGRRLHDVHSSPMPRVVNGLGSPRSCEIG